MPVPIPAGLTDRVGVQPRSQRLSFLGARFGRYIWNRASIRNRDELESNSIPNLLRTEKLIQCWIYLFRSLSAHARAYHTYMNSHEFIWKMKIEPWWLGYYLHSGFWWFNLMNERRYKEYEERNSCYMTWCLLFLKRYWPRAVYNLAIHSIQFNFYLYYFEFYNLNDNKARL